MFPPFQGGPGGPKHGREIHRNNGAGGLNAKLLELEGAINAIGIVGDFKYDGDGPGFKLKESSRHPKHLT